MERVQPLSSSYDFCSGQQVPENFSEKIDAFVARQDSGAWRRTDQPGRNATWIYVSSSRGQTPKQGWKIHVSAALEDSDAVLGAFLEAIVKVPTAFKLAKDKKTLQEINNGSGGLSQIGKFITVYPRSKRDLELIASLVDRNTRGLRGPDVPSDLAYNKDSLVFFRYGDFTGQRLRLSTGELVPAIADPNGMLVKDIRETQFSKPDWATIPFKSFWRRPKLKVNDTLDGRLFVVSPLSEVPRGNVYIAVDLQAERLCAVKSANHNFEGRDTSDARSQLLGEATILKKLQGKHYVPELYDLLEQDEETVLVMEFVEGQNLSEFMTMRHLVDTQLSRDEIISLSISIVEIILDLHLQNIAHGDLKSTNIMITHDRRVRIIDFGLSSFLDEPSAGRPVGTRGYFRTDMLRNGERIELRDLYALGAVLYFIATGAEPWLAPNQDELLSRPLSLMNPSLDSDIADIVERCLATEGIQRYSSVQELLEALTGLDRSGEVAHRGINKRGARATGDQLRDGTELLLEALNGTPGFNPALQEAQARLNPDPIYFDINQGLAGAVIALARITDFTGEKSYRAALRTSACYLVEIATGTADLCPGLYNGVGGMVAALLLAARVLNCETLMLRAVRLGGELLITNTTNPDLFIGVAGIARAGVALHAVHAEPSVLERLEQLGEQLLGLATSEEYGGIYWTIPAGYEGMSGRTYLGFAHGAAGIADVLLDLYQMTGNESFLRAVMGAATWLARHAERSPFGGLYWPSVPNGPPNPAFWCHGAAGIGSFFARLAGHKVLPEAMDMARGAAEAVSRTTRWCSPNRCHGLAGSIEFMMEMFELTKCNTYLEAATEMSVLSDKFYRRDAERRDWQPGPSGTFDVGYMTGLSGLLSTLVRTSMKGEFSCMLRI
jgi:predicted Ser/Thr protein kinase